MSDAPLDRYATPTVIPAIFAPARNALLAKAAILGVLAPLVIFALHLQPVAAALLIAASVCAGYLILFGWTPGEILSKPVDAKLFGGCLLLGFALCLLGGEYHFFYSTKDWTVRDAVLSDLVLNRYPVVYHYLGGDFLLRAPLGMYMIPAAIGWAFGLSAAHLALLTQNSLLFSIIFYFVALLADGPKLRFLGLFILFGPVDIIPNLIESFNDYLKTGEFIIEPHLMFWNSLIRFWSQLPQIFWAPNHAISGWTTATLILLYMRREIDIVVLAISAIIALFWSPFGPIGAAPILIWLGLQRLAPDLLSRRTLIALIAAFGFAPLFVYLATDAGALSREWLPLRSGFLFWYLAAILFALPQAFILLAARNFVPSWLRAGLYLSIATMALMSTYRFGIMESENDMAMRCMLAPMFILAFAFCQAAPKLAEGSDVRALVTTAVITLSAVTGFFEIRRAIVDPPYKINDCNLVTVLGKVLTGAPSGNYLAHVEKTPSWLVDTTGRRLEVENRQCWPGHPFAKKLNDEPILSPREAKND